MYSKLLVPVDMRRTDDAATAVDAAAQLAALFNAELVLMTMEHSIDPAARSAPDAAAIAFKSYVDAQSERLGRSISGAFRLGDNLTVEIRETVEELDVDLVVMRSHDPKLMDYLVGSRSASVALHTPCSVLVLR